MKMKRVFAPDARLTDQSTQSMPGPPARQTPPSDTQPGTFDHRGMRSIENRDGQAPAMAASQLGRDSPQSEPSDPAAVFLWQRNRPSSSYPGDPSPAAGVAIHSSDWSTT